MNVFISAGTVDPNVQELAGRKDISTIMYILKDLLGANPQYKEQQLRWQQSQLMNPHKQGIVTSLELMTPPHKQVIL